MVLYCFTVNQITYCVDQTQLSMFITGSNKAAQISPSKNEIVFDPNLNEDEVQSCRSRAQVPTPTTPAPQPSGLKRATEWDVDVEEAYRFQTAGYRDAKEYCHVQGCDEDTVKRWPHNGWVKMLKSRNGAYIYFDKQRECKDKDLHKCKIFDYNNHNNGQ